MVLRTACNRWWVLMLRGICAIALGISAIVWPQMTLVTLVYLFGIFTLVDGMVAIALGFRGEKDGTVWWTLVLMGILALIAGIFVFAFPAIAALWLVALIAATAIIRGVFEIIAAIRLRKELDDEWVLALSGLMSLIFGGLILFRPAAGALAIVLLIGAYMIAIGVFAVALALRFRRMGHTLSAAT